MINRFLFCAALLPFVLLTIGCSESVPSAKAKSASPEARAGAIRIGAAFDQAIFDGLERVDLAWGGLLYDRFWIAGPDGSMPDPPTTLPKGAAGTIATNASWPTTNTKQSGISTWRCKSCHGWDYAGKGGQYAAPVDPFYTGLNGIIPSANVAPKTMGNPTAIFAVIDTGTLNGAVIPNHNFGKYLPGGGDTSALYALAYFVFTVQNEAAQNLAPQSTLVVNFARADQVNGYQKYMLRTTQSGFSDPAQQGGCAEGCHGKDGKAIIIHPTVGADPKDVASFAGAENMFEVLHKVRFGHSTALGSASLKMPGLVWYPNPEILGVDSALKSSVDIVAFVQNGLVPDGARGGRLYDDWVLETAATAPIDNQPLMALRSTDPNLPLIAPDKQWACSSCHGYDYAGSGFPNSLVEFKTLRNWTEDKLYRYLKTGRYGWVSSKVIRMHSFDKFLADTELWNLAKFLQEGVVDTRAYVAMNGRALGQGLFGPPFDGQRFFTGIMPELLTVPTIGIDMPMMQMPMPACNVCHGDDGKSGTANVNLTLIAWEAPWRFLHRARFGMPGSYLDMDMMQVRMPGMLELVLSDPIDSTQPMAVDAMLSELTDRSMDLQTYAQDLFIQSTPVATLQAIQAKTAVTKKALTQ